MTLLRDLAAVLRSKNAGPFQITLDLMFEDDATYERVLRSPAMTREAVAPLYGVPVEAVSIIGFARVRAIKVTVPRRSGERGSGSAFDRDVYGAQQHAPLALIEIA